MCFYVKICNITLEKILKTWSVTSLLKVCPFSLSSKLFTFRSNCIIKDDPRLWQRDCDKNSKHLCEEMMYKATQLDFEVPDAE